MLKILTHLVLVTLCDLAMPFIPQEFNKLVENILHKLYNIGFNLAALVLVCSYS